MEPLHKRVKAVVSDSRDWDTLSEYLDTLIAACYGKIESTKEIEEVWRQLGAVTAYKTIKRLRDDFLKVK